MIIRICRGQPQLALKIVQPGCDGVQLLGLGLKLTIAPVHCASALKSPMIWCGCFADSRVHRADSCAVPTPDTALLYPAFDIDDEGRVVFYFDSKLDKLPPGRYIGYVNSTSGEQIDNFDIDLCNRPFRIEQVAVTSTAPCGD